MNDWGITATHSTDGPKERSSRRTSNQSSELNPAVSDKVQQIANLAHEASGGPPTVGGGATSSVESAATKLEGVIVNKAVNSELAHAAGRAFQHGFFSSVKEAGNALRALSKEKRQRTC